MIQGSVEALPQQPSGAERLLKAVLPDFLFNYHSPSIDVQNVRSFANGIEATAIAVGLASGLIIPGVGFAPLAIYGTGKVLHAMSESLSKFRPQPQTASK